MFNVSCLKRRFGVSLSASRRVAVSDTACCSFLTMQRYKEYQRETIVSPDYFQLFFNKISRRVAVSARRRIISKIDWCAVLQIYYI